MSSVPEQDQTDGELLYAALRGDETAFTSFCVRSLPTLTRVLRAACRASGFPEDWAEDAAQESLMRAILQMRAEPPRQVSLGWLIRVGRNVLLDWARRQRRAPLLSPDDTLAASNEGPPNETEALWVGMERLATADREIIEAVLINETSPETIAEKLKISRWAIYKRYERALIRLRKVMERENE